MNELLNHFSRQRKEFVSFLSRLIEYRSYNGEVENINRFIDYLQDIFSGFHPDSIERISTPSGDILVMDFFSQFKDTIVLLAHTDTVKTDDKEPTAEEREGKLYGNGGYDMKQGIALFYFMLKSVFQGEFKIDKHIKVIFSPDEESGSKYSKKHIYNMCRDAKAVLIPEPSCPDGGVKVKRKAIGKIEAEIRGKAAHSGIEPEKGIDANRALAKLIIKIDDIIKDQKEVSFNPGIIEGGVRTNVVSPLSKLRGEIRGFKTEKIVLLLDKLQKIDKIGNAKVIITASLEHPALEFTKRNKRLYELFKSIAEDIKYELSECFSGGASDGSSLSYKGIPVLDGIGIKGSGAHSVEEYVEIDDFPYRAYLLTSLIGKI